MEVFGPESVDYERYKSAAELRPKGFFSAEPSIAGQEIERGKQQSIATLEGIIERFQEELAASQEPSEPATLAGRAKSRRVFIGHGRSLLWRELKDFIQDRLTLPWDEFNRVPIAGVANTARLSELLDASAIAFILLTGEDELKDGTMQARMNTVHEAGLFQGKLGFTKAIILLVDGCDEFSNIQGLGQIRFPKGNIQAAFEEIRRVLERERILGVDAA